jgi:hypothetical protein
VADRRFKTRFVKDKLKQYKYNVANSDKSDIQFDLALLAEATTRSVETMTLYGMVKLVSDLVFLIAVVWLVFGLFRVARPAKR